MYLVLSDYRHNSIDRLILLLNWCVNCRILEKYSLCPLVLSVALITELFQRRKSGAFCRQVAPNILGEAKLKRYCSHVPVGYQILQFLAT